MYNKKDSKPLYAIERFEDGFRITREDYLDATVKMKNGILFVVDNSEKNSGWAGYPSSIADFRGMKTSIINLLMHKWTSSKSHKMQEERTKAGKKTARFMHQNFKAWLEKSFSKGLTYLIYPEWQRLVEKADPAIVAIFKKYVSVRGPKNKVPPILLNPQAYEDKDFVRDALQYNALHMCLDEETKIVDGKVYYKIDVERRGGLLKNSNWRWRFSDIPGTYKALNKTLDNFPRGIPAHMAASLSGIHLTEPINDRIKMIAVLHAVQSSRYARQNHLQCIMKSTPEQIRKAFELYRKNFYHQHPHLKGTVSLRGSKSIINMISTICDFPEPHHGGIVSLYEKAHEWHRTRRYEYSIKEDEIDSETKRPFIPLPEVEGIRFLATVKEVRDEGREMHHCIASYASSAVLGSCYLFHCEYEGEKASTMVDNRGRVVQSFGPSNVPNKASEYAARQLGNWGMKIKEAWDVGSVPQEKVQELAEAF